MADPILLICHEATRTGGPRVALELFRRAKAQLGAPLAVQLLAGGPLAEPLVALSDVEHVGVRPRLRVVNSALAAGELALSDDRVPSLVYVHEEGDALRTLPATARTSLEACATRVLCVSDGARSDLEALGVDPSRIGILPPLVVPRERPDEAAVRRARAELEVDTGAPLVVGCGEAGWRKGADLFVEVARRLASTTSARFAWVGRRPRAFGRLLEHDTEATGLGARLRWLGEVDDALPYLAAADVLVSTSREDPQPLVPLEASMAGTPTAGFAVGGIATLGRSGAALAVPYPDTGALAGAIAELLSDGDLRERTAARARERLEQRHAPAVTVPRLVQEIETLLAGAPDREEVPWR